MDKNVKMPLLNRLVEKAKNGSGTYYKITLVENGYTQTAVITPANGAQNSYSVAKVFTVTAIGMLVDRGLLRTDERVCDILRSQLPSDTDPAWETMTVHHLLKHSAGFAGGCLDIDAENQVPIAGEDYLGYLFGSKPQYIPGTESRYSDAAYYLLSRVFTAKSGEKMDDYLLTHLFYPLGFREMAWSKCPMGYPMGATGLYVYTEDLAKLGVLYLNRGLYHGKQLVSAEWVETVLREGYEFAKTPGGGYGKGGMYGQMLIFYPKQDRVVAYHSFGGDGLVSYLDAVAKQP
ncbi:MAG: beta-lactamase family protein [Ruminococcaceae bacterium]|nr:beta-lactamase family protein [Oscillospiraceae bacterium]